MNWYSINFSLQETATESETEVMEWFQNYLRENFLSREALLYETDELTREGMALYIYSRNQELISALKKKWHIRECHQPAKEEICLIAGSRDLGDSIFK